MQPKNRLTSIRTLGLAALAALLAMAFLGASSAMAEKTVLCSTDENPCKAIHTITHVHETSVSKAKLLTTFLTVECDVLFLGDAVTGTSAPLVIEGKFTYTNCGSCTVTEENGPAEIEILKEGHEAASVTGERLFHVKCGGSLDCSYNGVGLKGSGKGPLLSAKENGETAISKQALNKEAGGFLCPASNKLDITTTPLVATYIVGEASPVEPLEEETEGRCNPALVASASCISGGSVNSATGNLAEEQTDIPTLGGRGPGLHVTRSYNSCFAARQTESGPFGYGWGGPYSASLSFSAGGSIATVRQDNGATAAFYKEEGKYVPPAWDLATLKESGENWIFTLPSQLQLEFNKSGQLTKETDRHKNTITLTYKEGNLETAKDAAGRTLTFTFKEGHVESIKDPLGTVKYGYESGNLTKVTLPGEEKANWTFKYDASHRLTEMTNGRGYTTITEYDEKGRVKLQKDPLERKRELEYKEPGGVKETTITEPNGSKTIEKFNEMGESTETTLASGTELAQTTKYKYTKAFELETLTDPNVHATEYTYKEGNRTSEVDANKNKTDWTYNSTHDVLTETTPKEETTTYVRNAAGDPETIKRPAPGGKTQETVLKWAANGDLEEETDPLNQETTFEYDSYGNLKAEINPEGDKRTWGYNEDGRVTSTVSPRGYEAGKEPAEYETEINRDAQGRPEVVTDPLGHKTKRKYDAAGNLEVLTNPNEHATTYVYDKANQRTEVKYANGNTAKTGYDSMGKVKSKTDGNNQTTKYERNLLEQVKEMIDPLERKTTMEYYAAGNLKKTKDPENRTITYSYYANDRLEKVDYSDANTADVTYQYGKDGEVTEMTDGTGTTKKTYDELDRLTEVKNGNSEVVKYEYDLGNQITEITYPNGKVVTQGFDEAGRLKSVKDWLGGETKFAYNRDSALKTTTFPAASENVDEYAYDEAGQLEATAMKRGAATLASITCARDKAGQLETATQTGLPGAAEVKYKYDERERLKEGAGASFEYDPANNPTKLGATTLKYDKASQLEKAGTTKFAFDKFGQRTKAEPEGGTATTYGWDQAGNLISVTKSGSIEDTYAYDGRGLRSSQKISGVKAQLAWDVSGELPLLLYDGTNYYIYGPNGLPFEQIAGETATYLHHDHLGSTRLLTNSSGEAKGKYTYTPYGEVEEHTGTASTPLGFNGQYRNESTGLIYLRAGTYDPATAQFMSVDPLVSETGEAYSYVGGNPVNQGDPSGLRGYGELQPPGDPPPPMMPGMRRTPVDPIAVTWGQILQRLDDVIPPIRFTIGGLPISIYPSDIVTGSIRVPIIGSVEIVERSINSLNVNPRIKALLTGAYRLLRQAVWFRVGVPIGAPLTIIRGLNGGNLFQLRPRP